MSIATKKDALGAFHVLHAPHDVIWSDITDKLPAHVCAVFPDSSLTDCWFIKFGLAGDEFVLRSSRLTAVSKSSGEIIYDGCLNDEG